MVTGPAQKKSPVRPPNPSTLSLPAKTSEQNFHFPHQERETEERREKKKKKKKMRLLTHNMLSSNIKGVTNGFPLLIEAEKVVEKQVDFNPDFLKNMFSKIDYNALLAASKTVGYGDLPDAADAAMLDSDEFLRRFHHALLELHLEEGALVCPETGRRFPVSKGIPNMLLHEDEETNVLYFWAERKI
ncbi:hypothetical protein Vadar_001338 [Vaccinium darrowii]|uniref:Uncharacterized protein n=1 Tax=Vaccinium darrowii TaxID=229202 RepID=A0ACB7Y4N8_9ERIC|nr:hypothetical protein Vadar_001338 [Vaccinium darrowii]